MSSIIQEKPNIEFLYGHHLQRITADQLFCRNENHCSWRQQLKPLLIALGWKGTQRQLEEALPPRNSPMDMQDFRAVLATLGFASHAQRTRLGALNQSWLPVIVIDKNGTPRVITKLDTKPFHDKPVQLLLFEPLPPALAYDANTTLRQSLRRFYPVLYHVTLISLGIGALTLAPTYFNMAIFDHIIASGSPDGLVMLDIGVLLALASEILLRQLRGRRLGYFGARMDHFVSCSVFERLLALPPSFTERASISAQLARLRDFESVREFFTGPLATLFFEMPIVLIYLIAMAIIGHWLAFVPVALLGAYTILLWVMLPRIKERSRLSANSSTKRQEFLLETVSKLPAIRLCGLEEVWQQRYRKLSAETSEASFHAAFSAQALESASYVLMTLGGLATLSFGVIALIDQNLTTGALVASMMIIWRILAPMQIACASITRLQQLSASTRQVQKLLAVPPEYDTRKCPAPLPMGPKRITFYRVSLRYGPECEPALLGVSFEVTPGQVVAIRGGNGSGKSTILKMLLGLYQPQGGSVRIDGMDIRQIDPLVLRQSIAYVPQNTDFFPGTVRDNLRFAEPTADDKLCLKALALASALEDVLNLSHGLDTMIAGEGAEPISYMLGQRLNLARAYIRPSPIMLFDEASYALGKENDWSFAGVINALRGRSTVMIVTHREDHMRLADQLLVLDKGELTHAGPPTQVLTVLKGKRA